MDVIIDTSYVTNINIQLDKPFDFSNGLENYSIEFSKKKNGESGLFLFIKHSYNLLSQDDNSSLKIEITTLYNLDPINKIDADDVFICIQSSQERSIEVISSLFKDTQNTLEIEQRSYESMKDEISGLVSSIKLL